VKKWRVGLVALLFVLSAIVPGFAASSKLNIVVSEFIGKGVPQEEASIVSEFIRVELNKVRLFNIIERSQIETILKEQKMQYSGVTTEQDAVQMGKLVNCQKVIIGNVMAIQGSYYVTAKVVNVETGEIEVSSKEGPVKAAEFGVEASAIAAVIVKKLIGLESDTSAGVNKAVKVKPVDNSGTVDENNVPNKMNNDYQQGFLSGKAAGKNEASTCLWGGIGFACGPVGVLASYITSHKAAPKEEYRGKSGNYANGYVDGYTETVKKKETAASWIGCIISTLLFGLQI